jgi:phosphatidylserine/phosphatidylglycerophosphate/cardiolipin synthase-like enzyme
MSPERRIVEAAYALASSLPSATAEAVASAILSCPDSGLCSEIARRVPHHHHRELALSFVSQWRNEAGSIDPRTVAVAIQTAALSEQVHRDSQSVELAWTGPNSEHATFRRTEQAVLQLLDAAKHRITLVSFAVYRITNIANALMNAANRGVQISVILETPDRIEGEGEYNTIHALGEQVAQHSTVYYWPRENRPLGENNKVGILHVKCAVADGQWLFLSSANLTQQAFTINMELGMLVRGGTMPGRVEQLFDRLIQTGQLRSV